MQTFSERVVACAKLIPNGRVTTYGRIARAAGGGAMASQSVTAILGKAHQAGVQGIPFHRIVYADGSIWLDDTYREVRMALYKQEGIEVLPSGKVRDFDRIVFDFQ